MIEEIFAFLAWLVTVPAALADGLKLGDVPTMATPQMSLDNPAIVSAIIGSGSAIAVILLRDGLFAWIKASWLRKRTDDEVYRRYLGPLAEACAKIVWRSKEIFLEHRHSFLNTATLPRDFNEYKRISTLYRIASLLGWVRGMEIELSSLAAHNPAYTAPIAAQITAFRKALADGPDVERDRLLRICGVWGLDTTPMEEMNIAHLAGRFEVKSHSAFGDEGKALSDAVTMDHDKKLRALRCLGSPNLSGLSARISASRLVRADTSCAMKSSVVTVFE